MTRDSVAVVFHNADTTVSNGNAFGVGGYTSLTVEIYGDGSNTARTVTFYCKGPSGTLRPIQGVRVSDFSMATSTTGSGEIWQFDITGLDFIVMDLTSITGGSVTVKGRAVA